jgi:YHS domain-containing protein
MARLATTTNTAERPMIDPVCHMKVDPMKTSLITSYQGKDYYFCAQACRRAFEKNPEKYLSHKPLKHIWPAGRWGRYLRRMAKSNKELFGERPSCH